MKKVFAEIGFGNETFFSTEIEEDGKEEYRIPRFIIPTVIRGYYIRVWVGTNVYILSTRDGFERGKKDKKRIKILVGVSGEE